MIKFINLLLAIIPVIVIILAIIIKRKEKAAFHSDRCAALWERAVAYLIDIAICVGFVKVVEIALKKIGFTFSEKLNYMFLMIVVWLYFSILESSKLKSTLGKKMQRIVVVNRNGDNVNILMSSVRTIFFHLSALYLLIGHITIFFTKYKQGVHDIISKSYVLREQEDKKYK